MDGMLAQIEQRTGRMPKQHLVDGGYMKLSDIEKAAARGVAVLAPPTKPRDEMRERHKARANDSAAIAAWRKRMGTKRAATLYKERAATAETVNAELKRWRGLGRIEVRGTAKVLCLALWLAITYNLLRCFSLGALM